MKFVKGIPHKDCKEPGWYLQIDNQIATHTFIADILDNRAAKVVFDQKTPECTVRPIIDSINKLRLGLVMGERNGWYMNRNGGMCADLYNITETLESDRWPEIDRIQIKRWPNGKHFYAKVDGIDVEDRHGNVK